MPEPHTWIIGLLIVSLVLTITNTVMLSRHISNQKENWVNGGEVADNALHTKRACSCPSYGFKNQVNMPYNDDSDLYRDQRAGWE